VSEEALEAGAWRIGTSRELLLCAKGIPENHTGGVLGVKRGIAFTRGRMGNESERVPGGGRIKDKENSEAKVNMGVCFCPGTERRREPLTSLRQKMMCSHDGSGSSDKSTVHSRSHAYVTELSYTVDLLIMHTSWPGNLVCNMRYMHYEHCHA
jgi:hypothetical protein